MFKPNRRKKCICPRETLIHNLTELMRIHYPNEILPNDVPTKWEKHGDLVLLPSRCFQNPVWLKFGDELWNIVADALKAKRIARKYKVKNDNFRSPNVELLKGSDGWVVHIDNKIKYSFDVTKCMFSSGNISEKLRIAKFSCEGETVVDLYAGIGYFTLPYLIYAKATLVHACEWNSNAIEALEKSLELNGVKEKCIIHFGDNRKVCPEKVADRVNLGLIPSSEVGWETACRALKTSGGILHIHGNVASYGLNEQTNNCKKTISPLTEWNSWAEMVKTSIKDILYNIYKSEWNVSIMKIIHVKSYAPHIDHLVVDMKCKPEYAL